MKHYRATPIRGTVGEPITRRGLTALVHDARALLGLESELPHVRSRLQPSGTVFRAGPERWLLITHDAEADAAYEAAQHETANEAENDFMYDVIVNVTGDGMPGETTEYFETRRRQRGLRNVFLDAAQYVRDKFGAVPESMEPDAIEARLPNIRSQMWKSRNEGRERYPVPFPTHKDGYWKAPNGWSVRVFVAIAKTYEPPAQFKGWKK